MKPGVDEQAGIHHVLPLPPHRIMPRDVFIAGFKDAKTKQERLEWCIEALSGYGMTGDPVFDEYRR